MFFCSVRKPCLNDFKHYQRSILCCVHSMQSITSLTNKTDEPEASSITSILSLLCRMPNLCMQPLVNLPLVACANVCSKQVLRLKAIQATRTDKLNELSCRFLLALLRAHFSQHVASYVSKIQSIKGQHCCK